MTRSTVGPFDGQTPALPAGRIHLIGIGGAGMSAVAELLRGQGRDVSGTDREPSATLARLRALGVDARSPHDPGLVDGAGSVVRSTAIRPDNPELVRAAELGLAVVHRSEALAALTARGVVVAVSGTHGKTTVTAMTAAALEAAGLDPTYAIGASTVRTGSGAKTGAGGIAVIEADESDGSFLAYAPDVAVIANVEPDHLDHYGSPEAVEAAFAAFARRVKPGGVLIACADDPGAARVAARARAEGQAATTYGFAPAADVRIESVDDGGATERDMEPAGFAQVFVIAAPALGPVGVRLGRPVAPGGDTVPGRPAFGRVRVRLALPGRHNALNATAALLAALAGAERLSAPKPLSAIVRGLETFAGTHRRFEWRGQARGVRVYDDYAHLPTEVEATLTAARQLAGPGRVFAAFQPHLYSRTQAFAADFAAALSIADGVAVLDVYPAREDPIPGVDGGLIASHLAGALYLPDRAALAAQVAAWARPSDVVMVLGAGDIVELTPGILTALAGEGAADGGGGAGGGSCAGAGAAGAVGPGGAGRAGDPGIGGVAANAGRTGPANAGRTGPANAGRAGDPGIGGVAANAGGTPGAGTGGDPRDCEAAL